MLVGIGLIGTLTATVASIFVKEHTDASATAVAKSHGELTEKITLIDNMVHDIERRLGASTSDTSAIEATSEAELDADTTGDADDDAQIET
jgi:hypothetical protein